MERLSSRDLCAALVALEERPWAEWRRGKELTQNALARLLKPFGIRSRKHRFGDDPRNGYAREDFGDAFDRYLPSAPDALDPTGTSEQVSNDGDLHENPTGTLGSDVPVEMCPNPLD